MTCRRMVRRWGLVDLLPVALAVAFALWLTACDVAVRAPWVPVGAPL